MVSKQLSAVHEEWGKLHLWSWCKVSELYSHLATSVTCEKKLTNYRQLKREGNKTYHYISYHIVWYNTRKILKSNVAWSGLVTMSMLKIYEIFIDEVLATI